MILALTACLSFVATRGGIKFGGGGRLIIICAGKNPAYNTTVLCIRNVFTKLHFSHILLCYRLIPKWINFPQNSKKQHPIMTMRNTFVWSLYELIEIALNIMIQNIRLCRMFTFQQDNNPKHTAKITKEWLRDNSVNVLEWPGQSPDLNTTEQLERSENWCTTSNLMVLERSCKGEWEKPYKKLMCQACSIILKKTVIAAKGASTKYWAKAVNTYVQ